jgi:hypothetical protein
LVAVLTGIFYLVAVLTGIFYLVAVLTGIFYLVAVLTGIFFGCVDLFLFDCLLFTNGSLRVL